MDSEAQRFANAIGGWLRTKGFFVELRQHGPNFPREIEVSCPGVYQYPPRTAGVRQLRSLIFSIEDDDPHLVDVCTDSLDLNHDIFIDLHEPDSFDRIRAICDVYLVDSLDKLVADMERQPPPV